MSADTKAEVAKADKAKRTILTPEQRIAKAEKDLAELKAKAASKAKASIVKIEDELKTAKAKLKTATDKVATLEQDLASAKSSAGIES